MPTNSPSTDNFTGAWWSKSVKIWTMWVTHTTLASVVQSCVAPNGTYPQPRSPGSHPMAYNVATRANRTASTSEFFARRTKRLGMFHHVSVGSFPPMPTGSPSGTPESVNTKFVPRELNLAWRLIRDPKILMWWSQGFG